MAKPSGGLTKWFKEEWVDIGRKKKGGGHAPCGRKKASTKKKGYPKCVPKSKAASMTAAQNKVNLEQNPDLYKKVQADILKSMDWSCKSKF